MKYYILNLSIDNELDNQTKTRMYNLYKEAADFHNMMATKYLNNQTFETFDSGFDLYVVNSKTVNGLNQNQNHDNSNLLKLNHHIKCEMRYIKNDRDMTCGYYLYPRSSTGTKTPLRLANSVGIIDSGYRGNIIAAFDNMSNKEYTVCEGQRLTQICPPNLSHVLFVRVLQDENQLNSSERGASGFGSTGK